MIHDEPIENLLSYGSVWDDVSLIPNETGVVLFLTHGYHSLAVRFVPSERRSERGYWKPIYVLSVWNDPSSEYVTFEPLPVVSANSDLLPALTRALQQYRSDRAARRDVV